MRKIIAALQVSLDGLIEGPNGELDWVASWEDAFDLLTQVDTFVLGGGMYPGYEQYWGAVMSNPRDVLPFTGRPATEGEIEYARIAGRTPHIVLSTTLRDVAWKNTSIVRTVEAIRELKRQPGADIHAVGGAGLVKSLFDAGLIDEFRLVVQPVVLGAGKSLFSGVADRHALRLVNAETMPNGAVRLTYHT